MSFSHLQGSLFLYIYYVYSKKYSIIYNNLHNNNINYADIL